MSRVPGRGTAMFAELESVKWGQYRLSGDQEGIDLTKLLQHLISQNEVERDSAENALATWPMQRIGWYGAIPEVMRWLLRFLSSEEVPDKRRHLALLLSYVVDAQTYLQWFSSDRKDLYYSIVHTFQAGLPVYVRLLEDDDPEVCVAAARAVGHISSDESGSHLLRRLQREEREGVREAIMGAIATQPTQEALPFVWRELGADSSAMRMQAARAACNIGREITKRGIQVLAAVAMDAEPYDIDRRAVAREAVFALQELGCDVFGQAVEQWVGILPQVPQVRLFNYVANLIEYVFDENAPARKRLLTPSDLSPRQARVLRSLVDYPPLWQSASAEQATARPPSEQGRLRSMDEVLRSTLTPLPKDRDALRRFVDESDQEQT
jgi:HEAT repeats